jgi:carbon monoxide dehydrogenase subunit G
VWAQQGQGHFTVLAQIVADALGVGVEDVRVVTGDTREFHWGTGTFASRGAVVAGSACHAAAMSVRGKILDLASAVLGVAAEKLELGGGRVKIAGSDSPGIAFGDLAGKANPLRGAVRPGTEPASRARRTSVRIAAVPRAACTHDCRSRSRNGGGRNQAYLVVHDCGTIINPLLVEGQIHGGVAHGIGNAFYEQLVYDEQAQLMNASFMDYLLPTATDVPPIETAHRETPSPFNVLGMKAWAKRLHSDGRGVRAGGRGRARRRVRRRDHGNSHESESSVSADGRGPSIMNLSGTFTFAGPRPAVWALLHDPAVLAKVLPGTKSLVEAGPDRFQGTMKVSIGPLTAAEFAVTVSLTDQTEPSHFAMQIDGKGGVGFVRGSAIVDLADGPDAGTVMTYSSDVQIGGRIAAVGQRMIESVARMMMKQAFDALNAEVQARVQGGA